MSRDKKKEEDSFENVENFEEMLKTASDASVDVEDEDFYESVLSSLMESSDDDDSFEVETDTERNNPDSGEVPRTDLDIEELEEELDRILAEVEETSDDSSDDNLTSEEEGVVDTEDDDTDEDEAGEDDDLDNVSVELDKEGSSENTENQEENTTDEVVEVKSDTSDDSEDLFEEDDNVSEEVDNDSKVSQIGKIKVQTEQEQIEEAAVVIRVLDAYRKLNEKEKNVATQFITEGEHESLTDAEVVVKVINIDNILAETMKALREAYDCDSVERAFYVMELEEKILHSLGDLVSVFSTVDYDPNVSNLHYAKKVVADIEKLGDHEMNFIKTTESVLSAKFND